MHPPAHYVARHRPPHRPHATPAKVHAQDSPTAGRGVAAYLRTVSDESLKRCLSAVTVPFATVLAARIERDRRALLSAALALAS